MYKKEAKSLTFEEAFSSFIIEAILADKEKSLYKQILRRR